MGLPVPAIGIATPVERAAWGPWDKEVVLLARDYVHAVQRAGGMALLLPPDPRAVEDPDLVLARVDALVLAGGTDVDPGSYGAAPHPETGPTRPERDAFEIALARRAVERDLPLLAICRGMQVLNAALGGTLHQHLPDLLGHEDHRRVRGAFGDHDVLLEEGSLAARAAGEARHPTKSHHHQAVDRLGAGLRVTGHAVGDGLVEAVELPGARFVLGVQWHPEADAQSRVVGALVAEARATAPAAP